MTTAAEAALARTPMGADLAQGVETLALDQQITFTRYVRLVLPVDGFIFWVRQSIVSPSAVLNTAPSNTVTANQAPSEGLAETFVVTGSLHYSSEMRQDEDEVYSANRVVFTAEEEVNDLNNIAPNEMWIAQVGVVSTDTGPQINIPRFAFSSQSSRYWQSDLWHYHGYAVYPDMESQIIDSPAQFDSSQVVSNSLPAWLALNSYVPTYGLFSTGGILLYPSHLLPANLAPPFGSVHIDPNGTEALSLAPTIGSDGSHTQLCMDKVRITLWGTRNWSALTFIDALYEYVSNAGVIGLMSPPVIRDEKRTQAELQTIAQKKTFECEVSYLQYAMRDLGRGIIKSSIVGWDITNATALI